MNVRPHDTGRLTDDAEYLILALLALCLWALPSCRMTQPLETARAQHCPVQSMAIREQCQFLCTNYTYSDVPQNVGLLNVSLDGDACNVKRLISLGLQYFNDQRTELLVYSLHKATRVEHFSRTPNYVTPRRATLAFDATRSTLLFAIHVRPGSSSDCLGTTVGTASTKCISIH